MITDDTGAEYQAPFGRNPNILGHACLQDGRTHEANSRAAWLAGHLGRSSAAAPTRRLLLRAQPMGQRRWM